MNNSTTNKLHLANQKRWNAAANLWAKKADSRGIWNTCHKNPSLVFSKKVLTEFKNIQGKKVCVLGSGDNQAVFALAGLGAKVTSVDISENQLAIAAERAKILGFDISFIQSDVTNLAKIENETFDFIYTGGHVAVWVSDLQKYYSEAARILKPKGIFIVDEYHPFRRLWKETKTELIIEIPYSEKGPFKYFMDEDVLAENPGNFESYEFHWTVSDFVNAIIQSGCSILEIDEYGENVADWERANFVGLPENLLVIGQKGAVSKGSI